LEARYAGDASVSVVLGDVLETPPGSLGGGRPGGYVVVGNVPYYITTPIIFQALEAPRPKRAVFLVQREVAERIVAPPGGKTYGSLSVNVRAFARAALLFGVKAGAFQPHRRWRARSCDSRRSSRPSCRPTSRRRSGASCRTCSDCAGSSCAA